MTIHLTGKSFGNQADGVVTIDGYASAPRFQPTSTGQLGWQDTEIALKRPDRQPSGDPCTEGRLIRIGEIGLGQESANSMPFTYKSP